MAETSQKKNISEGLKSPEMKSLVSALLLTRVYAETKTAQVEEVTSKILAECPIYCKRTGKQILEDRYLYTADLDSPEIADYYAECDFRLKKLGIKPKDMPQDIGVDLTAQSKQRNVEQLIIGVMESEWGFPEWTYMEDRKKMLDLVIGAVVCQDDFKNPLTGEAIKKVTA